MLSRFRLSTVLRRAGVLGLCVGLACGTAGAATRVKPVITKPGFDPDVPRIGLFEGIDSESLSVKVIAKDSTGGNLLIENKTDAPLTVEMPEAIVGVQVLPQIGGAGGFGLGGAGGGLGGGGLGGGGQGGGNQAFGGGGMGGGGMGGGMGGMGGGGMGGGGFFSIPAERTVRVPYGSVCLEHGKAEPHPRVQYKLVRVEEFTDNVQLQELLKMVGTGRMEQRTAQAAAWHLANGMSWNELAAEKIDHINRPDEPFFSRAHLFAAQSAVAMAAEKASNDNNPAAPKTAPSRVPTRTFSSR